MPALRRTQSSAPRLLAVLAALGSNSVTISWTNIVADSYNLYWLNIAGVTTANGTKITGATHPYPHIDLTAGNTYYYVVTAVAASVESGESAEVSATVPP